MVKYNETEKILLLSKYITSGMDARSFALSCGVPIPHSSIFVGSMAIPTCPQYMS